MVFGDLPGDAVEDEYRGAGPNAAIGRLLEGCLAAQAHLMEVMARREADHPLQGDIRVDDADPGGEQSGAGAAR